MVICAGYVALGYFKLAHHFLDKLECVLEGSVGLDLKEHGNAFELGLVGCVGEVILRLVILLGIEGEIYEKCATLYVDLCTLYSSLVKGFKVPASSCLYALVGKEGVLKNGVVILDLCIRLDKSGIKGASVTYVNNNTVNDSTSGTVGIRLAELDGGCLYSGCFLNGSGLFLNRSRCFFNRSGCFLNRSRCFLDRSGLFFNRSGLFFNRSFLNGSFLYGSRLFFNSLLGDLFLCLGLSLGCNHGSIVGGIVVVAALVTLYKEENDNNEKENDNERKDDPDPGVILYVDGSGGESFVNAYDSVGREVSGREYSVIALYGSLHFFDLAVNADVNNGKSFALAICLGDTDPYGKVILDGLVCTILCKVDVVCNDYHSGFSIGKGHVIVKVGLGIYDKVVISGNVVRINLYDNAVGILEGVAGLCNKADGKGCAHRSDVVVIVGVVNVKACNNGIGTDVLNAVTGIGYGNKLGKIAAYKNAVEISVVCNNLVSEGDARHIKVSLCNFKGEIGNCLLGKDEVIVCDNVSLAVEGDNHVNGIAARVDRALDGVTVCVNGVAYLYEFGKVCGKNEYGSLCGSVVNEATLCPSGAGKVDDCLCNGPIKLCKLANKLVVSIIGKGYGCGSGVCTCIDLAVNGNGNESCILCGNGKSRCLLGAVIGELKVGPGEVAEVNLYLCNGPISLCKSANKLVVCIIGKGYGCGGLISACVSLTCNGYGNEACILCGNVKGRCLLGAVIGELKVGPGEVAKVNLYLCNGPISLCKSAN